MAVVEMESLFSTSMPSFLETPSRIQSANQNELTKIAYKMINVMEHFVTDFQEFKTSTAERINKQSVYYGKMLRDMTQYKQNISNNKKSYYKMKIIDLGWNQNPYSK